MNLELVPLLLVVLLMISAGGVGVETAELVFEGEHEMTEHRGALIVGDATVTVPADAEITGPVYVIGGELRIDGTVEGNVTQLSGTLTAEDGAVIGGQLQYIGGQERIADGATITERTAVELVPAEPTPIAAYTPLILTTLVLALAGAWLSRTKRALLDNVGTAVREHPVISFTVGTLLSVTFLAVFVFMAFTLILLPVTILGLVMGLLTIGYGVIALGHLVGQRLETLITRRFETLPVELATALGVVGIILLLQVLGRIPIVGDIVVGATLLIGLGAVVLTYFGLQEFEPVELPE